MNPQQPYPHQPGAHPGYDQRQGAYAPPPSPPPAPRNGMGTASLVLGILAVVLAFVPILGFASYPLAILGILFGLVGLRRAGRRTATNRGVALTGLIASVLGFVLVVVATVLYVGAINAGVQSVDRSLNAVHHVTYKATSSDGSKLVLSYTQGSNGSGSRLQAASPWSLDTTVTGGVAVLTASSSTDFSNPDRPVGLTCSIVDKDTGKTVVTNTVPASGGASVTCSASNLGG